MVLTGSVLPEPVKIKEVITWQKDSKVQAMYDETWSPIEIAIMEVVKQLSPLHPIDIEQPIKYPNGVVRPKAYINLKDKIFYCPQCGIIPVPQQHPITKEYRVRCPACNIYADDGAHKDKCIAYKRWNAFAEKKLNDRN